MSLLATLQRYALRLESSPHRSIPASIPSLLRSFDRRAKMHTNYHALIGAASKLPIDSSGPIISFSPLVLPTPDRLQNLQLRVTVPVTGDALPIVLLSHGQGPSNSLSSLEGYAPLYEFWAAHGFAVLQPTHLSSRHLGLQAPKGQELFWQERAKDMVRILDNIDDIEAIVPGLNGRLDRTRVAVAGHSAGGLTAMMLLGASNTDPRDGSVYHKPETRIKAGVVLASVGSGGADISESGKQYLPFYDANFSEMSTSILIVAGDDDVAAHLTVRGADWHVDPYKLAPGSKDLLMLRGAKHGLGGISGWDAQETGDESPERLAVVQRMTWAYLRSQLYEGDNTWNDACASFKELEGAGEVASKR